MRATAPTAAAPAGVAGAQADQVLRKRIGWLNANAGLQQEISYQPIAQAAEGVDLGVVLEVLKDLEDSHIKVSNPTAWVLDTLQPLGGVRRGGGASAQPPKKRASAKEKVLRRDIGWLNNNVFQKKQISQKEVSEALSRLELDVATVIPIIKGFKKKAEEAKDDPTAHVIAALEAESQRFQTSKERERANLLNASIPEQDGKQGVNADAGELDDEVTQKIHWLNTLGGFDGGINSIAVADAVAAANCSASFTVQLLDQLKQRRKTIENPTAFIVARLRAGREDLLKRVQYLNDLGNLTRKLSYERIANDFRGVGIRSVMKVLQDLEDAKDSIKNPTAFVTAALKSRRDTLIKRISWLNKHGGLKNVIWYSSVAEAIEQENTDMGFVLEVLKTLEDRKELEVSPTAFVTRALRAEHDVRKLISWLNQKGNLQKPISYAAVMEAANPRGLVIALRALREFDKMKKKDTELEPTEAVLHTMRRMADAEQEAKL